MTEHDPLRDRFTHLVDDLRQPDVPIPDIDGVYRRAARRRTTHVAAIVVVVLVLLGGAFALRPSNGQTDSPIVPGPTTPTAPAPIDPTYEPPPAPVPTDGGGRTASAGPSLPPRSTLLTADDVESVFAGYFGSDRWTSASEVPARIRPSDSCAPELADARTGILTREASSPAEEAAIESSIAIVESDIDAEYELLQAQVAACAAPMQGNSEPRVDLPRAVVYESDLGCALSCTTTRLESVVIAHAGDRIAVVALWHYGQDTIPDESLVDFAQGVVTRLES